MNGPADTGPSRAVLDSALEALRAESDPSPPRLANLLTHLLSDHTAPDAPHPLNRAHRRQLVWSVRNLVGPDTLEQTFLIALPNLRLHPAKTSASLLADLGPEGLPSDATARAVLARFGVSEAATPDEQMLFDLFVNLLYEYAHLGPADITTNMAALMHTLSSLAPYAPWFRVVSRLDEVEGLTLPHEARWDVLAGILLHAPRNSESQVESALWGTWSHPSRQLHILDGLTSLEQDVFSFAMLPISKVVTTDDTLEASAIVQQAAANVQNSTWNSHSVIETLVRIADWEESGLRQAVNVVLEKAFKSNAELIILGLLQMPQPWSTMHQGLARRLFAIFLDGHANHQLVFYRIWQMAPDFLMNGLRSSYADNAMVVGRILDVAQDLKILDKMLEQRPFFYALDIAALAARRDFLNLDRWLQESIDEHGNEFVRASLDFVDTKVKDDFSNLDPQAEHTSLPLTVHTVATFLRVLRANGDRMLPEEIDYFKTVRNLCLQLHPRLMNLAPGAESQEPGLHVATFSQDVHKEVDGYYRQMYEEQISIKDIISLLQRTKTSSETRDGQIFACMVHTLFDEYRCFESYYPPRELAMTAVVFGSLIQHQLIDYIPLGIAIRYVLDALRKPPDSTMFNFGLRALVRFQERLPEWPQLSQALLSLPHVQQSHPELTRILRAAMSGEPVPSADVNGSLEPEEQPASFSAIDADPLPEDIETVEPDEQTSDKILFILNNMSPNNLSEKLVEARKLITPELHQWLSSYLVLQRVSIEQNNHGLYTEFLDGLDAPLLTQYILHETLAKAKMLLNSDKTVQSTQERTILKNLGSWLGNLTLARNKPIRHRNVAFKELLIQGYDSNRLLVAIPFVCKVLEQCARSTIFVPPNPWLMAILRLLVELYQFAELKLNLKFEIEVLCKSLSIDLKGIQCTSILRNRPQELAAQQLQRAQQQQLQEAQAQAQQQQQQRQLQQLQQVQQQKQQPNVQTLAGLQGQLQSFGRQQPQQVGALTQDMERMAMFNRGSAPSAAGDARPSHQQQQYPDTLAAALQNLPALVVFNSANPSLAPFTSNGALKRMICVAIERAIREIIHPVVERSVTIAAISTRELITKDFAMESDEVRMRKAAHQMAQKLAGSLALVTCKEPLRIAMVAAARNLFIQNGFTEQTFPEQAVTVIMQDNLDLACSVVERAAMEKSLPSSDEGLNNAYMARRDHRIRGRGYYWDANALAQSQYASTLPDLLKLKPDGLQPQQVRVYEEFGKLPRATGDVTNDDTRVSTASPSMAHIGDAAGPYSGGANEADATAAAATAAGVVDAGGMAGLAESAAALGPQESLEKLTQRANELVKLLQRQGLDAHESSQEARMLEQQIATLAMHSPNRDEIALSFSQKIVQLLYKSDSDIAREAYIHILERLCEVSLKAAKEVTAWLIYAEDERKFNIPVTVGLMRAGLISVTELDAQLAKFMVTRDFKPSVVDFCAQLAFTCLTKPAFATRQQLSNVISALMQAHERGKATTAADEFVQELQGGTLKTKWDVESAQPLREQLAFCFAEWVRLFQHSPNAEKSFIDFVRELQNQGILKGEEISSMFFRVCTEVGVDSYIKAKAVGGDLSSGIFQPIDAFSKLIVLMIKYHAGISNEQAKVHYLTKILSIVVLVFAQSHEELGPHFQQKPFFRLFSSLLHDLHLAQSTLGNTYSQSLLAISNTLNTLQPSFFPGFAFSWMGLISHRLFLPKLLGPSPAVQNSITPELSEGQDAFLRLFASMLRFLAPFMRSVQLQDTSRILYRGTLRIALVLLHDYPEFIARSNQILNDLIPPPCTQMRNLMLSSFPRGEFKHGLPDVFKANLSIKDIEQCKVDPYVDEDYLNTVLQQAPEGVRAALERALASGNATQSSSLSETLTSSLRRENGEYNVPLLNAIVLHSGMSSLTREDNILVSSTAADSGLEVLQSLLRLDAEGKYLTASAMSNQMRFPNRHTAYFSTALLHLYARDAGAREAILRVLLERVLVNRPHPWGLLVTIVELVSKEQAYPLPDKTPMEIIKVLERVRAGLGIPSTHGGSRAYGDANGHVDGVRENGE